MPAMQRSNPCEGAFLRPLRSTSRKIVTHSNRDGGAEPLPATGIRQSIRRALLRWYDRCGRDLPWRERKRDGYAQWVAEVMLQQTQVRTVIAYYERFMARFPSVDRLAAATDDELLSCWQGLGYYRRAANLHRAAKMLAADGGCVPESIESLRRLPGIGRYTAGAIASIAFGHREAAVDGNITRVYARLFHIDWDLRGRGAGEHLWRVARSMLPVRRCGDFNQALMDLGATVCTPNQPSCGDCPLTRWCKSFAAGDASSIPASKQRTVVQEIDHVAAVVRCRGAYWMQKRPTGGLWGGLWEFPNRSYENEREREQALSELHCGWGSDASAVSDSKGVLTHRLTHRVMRYEVFLVRPRSTRMDGQTSPTSRWIKQKALAEVAMSTACRKMLAMVEAG